MRSVAAQFEIPGRFVDAAPLGAGHIHDTYAVRHADADGLRTDVVQRINVRVFPDPDALMANSARIHTHLRAQLEREGVDPARRCLRIVPTRSGRTYWVDDEGAVWRCTRHIAGTRSVDNAESPEQARRVAEAFGAFGRRMSDLGDPPLAQTIPRFHDLAHRWSQLEAALRDDPLGRRAALEAELERAERGREALRARLPAGGLGALPVRVAHNDCKINNVLLDERSGEALCVIDLDTTMPGSLLADFGELVRTATCRAPEDEVRLETIEVDVALLEAVARGYRTGVGGILGPEERDLLPLAGPLMAFENGIRFLADHLRGDTYFKVHRPGQNLDRFRAQLRVMERLDARRADLEAALRDAAG